MGVRMTVEEDSIFVEEQFDLKPVDIKTSPYPGFATDLQQEPMTPLLLKAGGRGKIIDTIYEKRVNHVPGTCSYGSRYSRCLVVKLFIMVRHNLLVPQSRQVICVQVQLLLQQV